MTRVIIEGLSDRSSLIAAISLVLEVMNTDDAYIRDENVFVPTTADSSVEIEAEEDGGAELKTGHVGDSKIGQLRRPGQPTPWIACPRRGTHEALVHCWLCWSDVMRGAALEPEVLSAEFWRRTEHPGNGA